MKRFILFYFFFACIFTAAAQHIPSALDSIDTKEKVENLFRSHNEDFKNFKVKTISSFSSRFNDDICKRISDSLHITQSFYKADLDRNGYTDLLVIGDYYGFCIYTILNYGHDSITFNRLSRGNFNECTFPQLLNDSILRHYYLSAPNWREKIQHRKLLFKDLIYKFDDFVELNTHPEKYSIEKIEFETSGCYGICPIFSMVIDSNRQAVFNAKEYNWDTPAKSKAMKGVYHTVLQQQSYDELVQLLQYINLSSLQNDYAVNWTDDQTATLSVTFSNGQVKTIRDYGMIGTYGLHRLYGMFFKLRYSQQWK